METTEEQAAEARTPQGMTGIEKFPPRGVVQVDLARALGPFEAEGVQLDLARALKEPLPEARTVTSHVREFVPLRDQVMVRRLAENEMTEYGTLHIPEEGKEKPMVGIVLAVGRGKFDVVGRLWPCEVEPGDVVSFGRYSGTEHRMNGQTVLVMNESQIVGILR